MDIAVARADIERRLHDKEEEFEATRKNFARAVDSMSASLEGETRRVQDKYKLFFVFSYYFD